MAAWVLALLPLTLAAQNPAATNWPHRVTYEIFVQSFCDSDGNGIGDLKGLTSRLDYLQKLGVGGLWLMPLHPSPSYHKYDVTDYYGIHPDYGTLADFKQLINEAHRRNIKVIIDLVVNHASSAHPWFIAAKQNPQSPYRQYFVWAHKNDPRVQKKAENTGADSDNQRHWHPVPGSDSVYYGYFWGGMPDLNFDNPRLRAEIFKIGRYWLQDMGVDGFRLDAARHIFPDDRPADSQAWWVSFREEMQKVNPNVYLLGEVWAPAEVVAPYLKGLPALFNFDLSFALTQAVNTAQAGNLLQKLQQTRAYYKKVNPAFTDATFLTNHDQNRIMSAVQNNESKAKMAAALLLTLPGSPYLYYGEEIGMQGKKPDEHIREPFLWNKRDKDACRTTWLPPRYSTDQTVTPLAQQQKDKNALYHHYRTFIRLRNQSPVLSLGELQPVATGLPAVCAFIRTYQQASLAVLHNLSDQPITLPVPPALRGYRQIKFANKKAALKKDLFLLPAYSTLLLENR